jgi:hypothetical protein
LFFKKKKKIRGSLSFIHSHTSKFSFLSLCLPHTHTHTHTHSDSRCAAVSGECLSGWPETPCGGEWRSGLCSGGRDRRCCLGRHRAEIRTETEQGNAETEQGSAETEQGSAESAVDDTASAKCRALGGTCTSGYPRAACDGTWRSGQCVGPADLVCCIPPEKNTVFFSSRDSQFARGGADPLTGTGGSGSNVAIRWNDAAAGADKVDVVVHLHGYSTKAADAKMTAHALEYSGAVLTGRSRPTLAIVPRGRKTSNRAYDHPSLQAHLDALIEMALGEFASRAAAGESAARRTPSRGRLIITCHSGGGKNCFKLAERHDPHEVHVFDATYYSVKPLLAWARASLEKDKELEGVAGGGDAVSRRAAMVEHGHALRMLYKAGSSTAARGVATSKALAGAGELSPWYRAENARESHMMIPVVWGPRLLADAAANA